MAQPEHHSPSRWRAPRRVVRECHHQSAPTGVKQASFDEEERTDSPRHGVARGVGQQVQYTAPNRVPSNGPGPGEFEASPDGLGGCDGCDGCEDDCSPCDDCGPCSCCVCPGPFAGRLWCDGEYLLWWDKTTRVPVLATTSTAGTPQSQAGILGLSTTTVVLGGDSADIGARSGPDFCAGLLVKSVSGWRGRSTYMFLGRGTATYTASSQDFPILARPYFNARTSAQDAVILAYPNVSDPGSLKQAPD